MSTFLQRSQLALQITFSLSDFPKQQLVIVSPSLQRLLDRLETLLRKKGIHLTIFGQGQKKKTHQEKRKRMNFQGTGGPRLSPSERGFRRLADHWLLPPGILGSKFRTLIQLLLPWKQVVERKRHSELGSPKKQAHRCEIGKDGQYLEEGRKQY